MKFHTQEHVYLGEGLLQRGSCYPTVLACLLDLEIYEVPYFHLLYFSDVEVNNINEVFQSGFTDKGEEWRRDYYISTYSRTKNLWYDVCKFWLASKSYRETYIENIDQWVLDNPNQPYMVTGLSSRNIGHVVIYKDKKLYWDPHPSREGLTKIDEKFAYKYLKKIV